MKHILKIGRPGKNSQLPAFEQIRPGRHIPLQLGLGRPCTTCTDGPGSSCTRLCCGAGPFPGSPLGSVLVGLGLFPAEPADPCQPGGYTSAGRNHAARTSAKRSGHGQEQPPPTGTASGQMTRTAQLGLAQPV